MQQALKGTKMTETVITEACRPVVEWLDELTKLVDEVPPVDQPMRFGNKAFRTLIDRMNENIDERIKGFCRSENFERAVPELRVYLQESFGSYERIDYGTGHEMNFVVFLFCMFAIGAFQASDMVCAINKVFQ